MTTKLIEINGVTHVWEVVRRSDSGGYQGWSCGLFATYNSARAEVERQKKWFDNYHGPKWTKGEWSLGLDDEWSNDCHDWIKIRGVKVNP